MDIVDDVNDAQPTQEITPEQEAYAEQTEGVPFDQEGFDHTWRSFYVQNMEQLRRIFATIGEALKDEMGQQIPNFDPEGEHKELFEASVIKNVPPTAEPYIMGVINGGLVFALEVARRYGFEITDLKATLDQLNPNADTSAAGEQIKEIKEDQEEVKDFLREQGIDPETGERVEDGNVQAEE